MGNTDVTVTPADIWELRTGLPWEPAKGGKKATPGDLPRQRTTDGAGGGERTSAPTRGFSRGEKAQFAGEEVEGTRDRGGSWGVDGYPPTWALLSEAAGGKGNGK